MNSTTLDHLSRATLLILGVATLCAGSAVAQVSIFSDPAGATRAVGADVTFSVAATGVNLSYQWRKNGATLSGKTQSYCTLTQLQISDSGNYDVQVTGTQGTGTNNVTVTSKAATLLVQQPVQITAQPQPSTKTVNASASVSWGVTASGSSLTYQWRKNGVNLGGQTSQTLLLGSVLASDSGTYDVVVANAVSSATSTPVTLVVLVAPKITTQPASVLSMPGNTIQFTVTASGSDPLSYQWLKNGAVVSGNNVAGATSQTLTIYSISANDGGTYAVQVANSVGSVTSDNAILTVGPAITVQPVDATVNQGGTASFAVGAVGSATLLYQWSFNGIPLPGQTSPTLTLTGVLPDKQGQYRVTVSNPAGSVTSSAATLGVQAPPTIAASPQSYAAAEGESVTLSVSATGAIPLTFQWNFQPAVGGTFIPVPGATAWTLLLTNVSPSNAGNYTVTVRNSIGSATSGPAQLTVSPLPKVLAQPISQSVPPGTNVSFSVTAAGRLPLSYQWSVNGNPIPGATNSVLVLTNVALADSGGLYTVVLTNASGSAVSRAARLEVSSAYAGLGAQLWSLPIPAGTPPAFGPDGTLYVDGVFAIAPNGTNKWNFPSSRVGAIAADGTVYLLNSAGGVDALDANGHLLWSFSQAYVSQIALRADGSLLCLGSSLSPPSPLAILLNADGTTNGIVAKGTASFPPRVSQQMFGAVAEDGTMYCMYSAGYDETRGLLSASGKLQALNPDGSPYWNTFVELLPNLSAPAGACALAASGNLIFSSRYLILGGGFTAPQLLCYSPTGVRSWETSSNIQTDGTNMVIGLDGTIILGDYEGYVGKVTLLNADGTMRWSAGPSDINPGDQVFTPAIAADGTIYFTARFSLYAFDSYGNKVWQFTTRESVNSSPTIGPDGVVYFSTQKTLYAIKGASPLAASSWPVVGGNPRRTFLGTHPPVFTTVPLSTNVDYGATAVFTAAASGTPPLYFQWRHYGTNLPSATNSTLTLSSVTTEDAGDFEVAVVNPNTGLMVRSSATLTVARVAAPTLHSVAWANGAISFTWSSMAGLSYQLQYITNLIESNWVNLGNPVSSTGSPLSATDTTSSGVQRFYRVMLMP